MTPSLLNISVFNAIIAKTVRTKLLLLKNTSELLLICLRKRIKRKR